MEVFEYNDVLRHILQALSMLCEGCYRISIVLATFSCMCGRAKAIRICYEWTRTFPQTEGINLRFQKYRDKSGRGLKGLKIQSLMNNAHTATVTNKKLPPHQETTKHAIFTHDRA